MHDRPEKVFRIFIMASKPRGVLYVGMSSDLGGRAWKHREHVLEGFTKRYCVDLSSQALKSAERKLGEHGVYLCGSFFELEFAQRHLIARSASTRFTTWTETCKNWRSVS